MKPQFCAPEYGKHNENLDACIKRVKDSSVWKKLDTIMIVPAGGSIPTKVVASWLSMYAPPNNKFYRIFAVGQEVGEAYSQAIENILAHPDLSKFKYIFTLEHDNIPQPDAMVKLLESMEAYPQFAGIGGLYWTKGQGGDISTGVPQLWGNPQDPVNNFMPQVPVPNTVQEVCGTGMGCNIFRLDMFKDPKLRKPWFKTQKEGGIATQDLYFMSDARANGYRFAVNTSILVGHYSLEEDIVY